MNIQNEINDDLVIQVVRDLHPEVITFIESHGNKSEGDRELFFVPLAFGKIEEGVYEVLPINNMTYEGRVKLGIDEAPVFDVHAVGDLISNMSHPHFYLNWEEAKLIFEEGFKSGVNRSKTVQIEGINDFKMADMDKAQEDMVKVFKAKFNIDIK